MAASSVWVAASSVWVAASMVWVAALALLSSVPPFARMGSSLTLIIGALSVTSRTNTPGSVSYIGRKPIVEAQNAIARSLRSGLSSHVSMSDAESMIWLERFYLVERWIG